ncbi:MAG: ABC transporter permease [Acidobacteriota bacterium]
MFKMFAVLKREYLFRVKKKSFLIWTLAGPLLLVAVYSLPVLFLSLSSTERNLAVVDVGGRILPGFLEELKKEHLMVGEDEGAPYGREAAGEPDEAAESGSGFSLAKSKFRVTDATLPGDTVDVARRRMNEKIAAKEFDAYLIIGRDPDHDDYILYGSRSSGDVPDEIKRALHAPTMLERARLQGVSLSSDEILSLARRVEITPIRVDKAGQEVSKGMGQQMAVVGSVWAMGFLFYIVFLLWGSNILRGIVEEKNTRITEVVLSSVTPVQFMVGKVAGIGMVALTQLVVWVGCALGLTLASTATIPQIARLAGGLKPSLFGWFILLFLLGFAMYSVIYAAIGSMVTSTQEAEQAAMPVALIIVASFFAMFSVQAAPDSTFAIVASLFPLTAPLVMLMRLGVTEPALWQIALSLLLQVLAICGLAWTAARIFRVGVLMYGKRATIPEVWRWIRSA